MVGCKEKVQKREDVWRSRNEQTVSRKYCTDGKDSDRQSKGTIAENVRTWEEGAIRKVLKTDNNRDDKVFLPV